MAKQNNLSFLRAVGVSFLRELKRFGSDRVCVVICFVIPPILFTLFCFIYYAGLVRGLPVAVCDNDNSSISRTLVRSIEASSVMKVVAHVNSAREIEDGLRRGIYLGGFYLPNGMERDIKRGHPVFPVIYKNSQNLLIGNTLFKEAMTIFRTFNAGVLLNKFRKAGLSKDQAIGLVNPVATDITVLYNPNFNYSQFLSPGLIFAQFQVIIILTFFLIIAREWEENGFTEALTAAGGRGGALIIGKSLPYLIVHCATAVAIYGILFPLFDIKINGSIVATFVVTFLFILASSVPGMLIGMITRNQLVGMEVSILLNMPAFMFSGFAFPMRALPEPFVFAAQLLPFTHFSNGFFKVALAGLPLQGAFHECVYLLCFVFIPAPIVMLLMRIKGPLLPFLKK